jgi:hypothetical protein
LYGAGGGNGGTSQGNGAQGIIVFTYNAGVAPINNSFFFFFG